MKKLLLLLALFYLGNAIAQDPILTDIEWWYLHDLAIDGESNVPPTTVYVQFESNGDFRTSVCPDTSGNGDVSYLGTNEFLVNELNWLAGSCPTMELDDYNFLYQSFWFNDPSVAYLYEIVSDGDNHTLTIISAEGNIAIYGNELLGLDDYFKTSISIFPNPTSNILNLQISEGDVIQEIIVYNIQGKQLRVTASTYSSVFQLNTENLKSGIYFIEVIDTHGQRFSQRFIKQ